MAAWRRWAVALGPGEGTTTQMWSPAAPCGNLPVFNVGERTAGGQVLPNGNRALQPPVKKFSTWTCNKFSDKFFMLDMTFWAEALSSYLMKNLLNKAFCIQKKKSRWLAFVFIGPESDHCLPSSLTHWLTHSLTHACLVNLIEVTLVFGYANSKLVEVVTVADVDA